MLIDNENIIKGTITDPGRFTTTGATGASQTFMDDYVSTVKAEMKNIADKKLVMRDSLGRKLSIRNLAEMTARFEETKKRLNSLKDQGIEIVLASSHNNASKRCEIWQGKLFILDVSTDAVLKQNVDLNYKPTPIKKVDGIDCYSLRDAMAHGFLGYNCRHRLIKYQKGMDLSRKYPNEQIEQERSLEINQRAMEREIRNCKINQTMAIDKASRLEWINKSKIAQQRYAEYCTKNKLTMYPWRTSITKAERSLDIDYDGEGLSYGEDVNIRLVANDIYESARVNERIITPKLVSIAEEFDVKLEGLDYRLKTKESLARKITSDYKDERKYANFELITEKSYNIHDVNRYTIILPINKFVEKYKSIQSKIKTFNFKLFKEKNTFKIKNCTYKGINNQYEINGKYFELQFHTAESFELKNGKLHELYEKERILDPQSEEAKQIKKEETRLSSMLTIPSGIDKI